MKKITLLFLFCVFQILRSQVLTEVKELQNINEKYYQLLNDYTNQNKKNKKDISFIKYIDSLQAEFHKEEMAQLQKIKEKEEGNYPIPDFTKNLCNSKPEDLKVIYKKPNFGKYISNKNFPTSKSYKTDDKELTTTVNFIVEKNGNVAFVKATGNNEEFNKEAELTLYKQQIYMPKCTNGFPERSRFRMPITLKFKKN